MSSPSASRLAATIAASGDAWRVLDGSAVLADLSGFTRLTEVLVGTGPEGVETLHRALTACFGALLDHSIELGGDVLGFAGDAALVWFDGDGHPERAARAAAAMPTDLAAVPSSTTGRTRLRASVGVHTGEFMVVRTHAAGASGLFLCGPPMTTLARLESAAAPMQVRMSESTAAALPPTWRGPADEHGVVLERRRIRRAVRPAGPATAAPESAAPESAVTESGVTGRGEHRVASIGFLMVPGTDALAERSGPDAVAERIQHVTDVVARVADEHAVTWLDTDVGADCVKFLLAAGVPRAVDDDHVRLVSALNRIVAECEVPVRAGAQRGRVFSAQLGVRSRRSLTVLGDAVNVAARALGKAVDGDLVVADGLGVDRDRSVVSVPMGPQRLKNRAAPMPMWRVSAVARGPRVRSRRRRGATTGLREGEWQQLAAVWKGATDGDGASVELAGQAGMGASELVAELADLAGGAATQIVADRFRRHVPYAGLASVVHALATDGGDLPESATLGEAWTWLASFVRLLPGALHEWAGAAIATVTGGVVPSQDPRTVGRRARQVLVALLDAAAPRPWLLVVEDADQLDDASTGVVDDLAKRASTSGHVVVTTRDVAVQPAVADVTMTLDPLDDGVLTLHVRELAPQLRDDQIERIVSAAGGNPLVVTELLTHADAHELPDSLQRLAVVLVDSLPDDARDVVLDASVFGIELDSSFAADVLDDVRFLSLGAWRSADRILRPGDRRSWRFRHEAYRRVAYETLSFERRRQIHGAIADRLCSSPEGNPALLALHLEAAGRLAEAYPVALCAAATAKASGALVDAVSLAERAIVMAERLDPGAVGDLLIELGETRLWTGDLPGAVAAYRSAGRRRLAPLQRARLCELRADLELSRRQVGAALRWIRAGMALAASLDEPAVGVTVRLLLHEAVRLDLRGRGRDALGPAREALAMVQGAGDPALVGLAHLQMEAILFGLADPLALTHGEAAIEVFTTIGDDRLLDRALNNTGLMAMYLGRWDEALSLYGQARAHAERCGHAADMAVIDQNMGFLLYRRGQLDEAEALARNSRRVLLAVHAEYAASLSALLLAMTASSRGRFDEAEQLLADARGEFARFDDPALVVDCDVVAMEMACRRGRPREAVALAARIASRLAVAEPEVAVSFDRILGAAEAATTDVAGGVARVRRAIGRARDQHLLYEVYLGLGTLARLTDDAAAHDEHRELARSLGVVPRRDGGGD